MKKVALIIGILVLIGVVYGQNNGNDTIFDKDNWMNSIFSQHFDKIATEYQRNFNHTTPFIVTKILDHSDYYTIDIIDTTHQYRYTIISVKDDRCQTEDSIKVNETYYLTIKKITKSSGLIGTSEIPYDITFKYHGKKIRYRSTDILQNGPPVTTKNIKGILYVP